MGLCTPIDTGVYVLSHANGLGGTPTWDPLNPSGDLPAARIGHTTVYDPKSNRLILFGGGDCCGGSFNDTWVLVNANGMGGPPSWQRSSRPTTKRCRNWPTIAAARWNDGIRLLVPATGREDDDSSTI